METFRKEFTSTFEDLVNFDYAFVCKEKWVFDENGITFEFSYNEDTIKRKGNGEILKCFYPYGNLKKIKFSKGWIEVHFYDNHAISKFVTLKSMSPRENDLNDMKIAVKFAKKQQKVQGVDFNKTRILETVTENKYDEGIFIMRCEICGQVFQYTYDDMKRHAEISLEADRIQRSAGVPAVGLGAVVLTINAQRAENMRNSQVDYSSCPKCHSKNLKRITKEELNAIQANESKNQVSEPTSNLDELKKFKELLDMGAITQEEFEAKKKQLLGL